jgi:hypothetical protein
MPRIHVHSGVFLVKLTHGRAQRRQNPVYFPRSRTGVRIVLPAAHRSERNFASEFLDGIATWNIRNRENRRCHRIASQISNQLSRAPKQILTLCNDSAGFDVTMQAPPSAEWWYYYGLSEKAVWDNVSQNGARLTLVRQNPAGAEWRGKFE